MEEKMLADGDRINDRYELILELGEGGMGEVWKAFDLERQELVAVKIFKPEGTAEDLNAQRRFLNEARAQIQINHSNVVSTIDVGLLPDSRPYLVMELLDGETLEKYLARKRRLSPAEVRALLVPVASALAAVHQAGIVHRDLKPGNIMLVSLPGHRGVIIPKVLDFGIAKILHGDERKLTQTGRTFGTPDYMSPERLKGNSASPSDDIFSLGVIAYQLITGDAPFHGNDVTLVITKIISPNPPASINEPGQPLFVPTVVEQTIMRALEKERDKRFASMEEMLWALLQWPETERETVAPVTRMQAAVPAPASPPTAPAKKPEWTIRPGEIEVDWSHLVVARLASARQKLAEGVQPEVVLDDVGRPRNESATIQPGHDYLGTGQEDSLTTEPRRRLSASQLAVGEPRLPLSPGTRHTLWLLALAVALILFALLSWQLVGDAIDYWQGGPPAPVIEQSAAPASAPIPAPTPPPAPPDTKAARPHRTNRSPPPTRGSSR